MKKTMNVRLAGIGCVSALGGNFSICMENLFSGTAHRTSSGALGLSLPEDLPLFAVDDAQVDFLPHLRDRGRSVQLAVVAAREALKNSDLKLTELQEKRVGVAIGTTVASTLNNLEMYTGYRRGENPRCNEIDRYFASNPAEIVAEEFNLCGPRVTVANACSSGADAIGLGASWLQSGVCDFVLAGGCDELSPVSITGFHSLMIASNTPCRPFDRDRNGLNLGEGAAMLVLQPGDENSSGCFLRGYGTACDAFHVTAPHPQGRGLRLALQKALAQALAVDTELAFINAHGTGTHDNDLVEMKVFDDLFPKVPYFSVKGVTGHTLGAAGAIEAALTCGCFSSGHIPKSHGYSTPVDGFSPPTAESLPLTKNIAFSQSLAFGGNNSVLVFQYVP